METQWPLESDGAYVSAWSCARSSTASYGMQVDSPTTEHIHIEANRQLTVTDPRPTRNDVIFLPCSAMEVSEDARTGATGMHASTKTTSDDRTPSKEQILPWSYSGELT